MSRSAREHYDFSFQLWVIVIQRSDFLVLCHPGDVHNTQRNLAVAAASFIDTVFMAQPLLARLRLGDPSTMWLPKFTCTWSPLFEGNRSSNVCIRKGPRKSVCELPLPTTDANQILHHSPSIHDRGLQYHQNHHTLEGYYTKSPCKISLYVENY